MTEQWLSILEYARKFAISDITIRRRIRSGKLKAVLRDGKYYIPVSAQDHAGVEELPPTIVRVEPIIKSEPVRSPEPVRRNTAPLKHYNHIPSAVAREVFTAQTLTVSADHLLKFCEEALKRNEDLLVVKDSDYKSKLDVLHKNLESRERDIKSLKEELADLQTLVQILEKRMQASK